MTNKFKVGDTVRILDGKKLAGNGNYSVTTGKEYVVVSFHEKTEREVEHIKVIGNFNKLFTICNWEYRYVELVSQKPTKNQRITALEETVAKQGEEIAELKLIVHQLRVPSTIQAVEDVIEFEGQHYKKVDRKACDGDVVVFSGLNGWSTLTKDGVPYKVLRNSFYKPCENSFDYKVYSWGEKVSVDVYELIVEDKSKIQGIAIEIDAPKSANQQRAEVIAKAKKFVLTHFTHPFNSTETPNEFSKDYWYETDFINKGNRSTVLVYSLTGMGERSINPIAVGRATCAEGDVFNQYIGDAIALGRALGLDVSEFVDAVQPTELVIGHVTTHAKNSDYGPYTVDKLTENRAFTGESYWRRNESLEDISCKIINDTNAEYEVNV